MDLRAGRWESPRREPHSGQDGDLRSSFGLWSQHSDLLGGILTEQLVTGSASSCVLETESTWGTVLLSLPS